MSLLICPDCKSKVSSDAHVCPKCGRPRLKNGVYETWKKDSVTPGGIVGGLLFLGLIFAGVRTCNSWVGSIPDVVEKSNKVAAGRINIPAGQMVDSKLDIKADFQNTHVKGNFTAAGGSGNDISAFIDDEPNFINWSNGHSSKVLWQTDGEQTTGSFDVSLSPGVVYYLVLSNKADTVSDKKVAIDATLTFKEPVAKTTAP